MQPKLNIRFASKQDLDILDHLEQDGFSNPWPKAALLAELNQAPLSQTIIAYTEKGDAVGYACWHLDLQWCELLKLTVTTKKRRAGIGRTLVEWIKHTLPPTARLVLEVREHNDGAIALYTGQGFKLLNRRPRYYRDTGEDALVFCWKNR